MEHRAQLPSYRNISEAERWGSMAAGAAMAMYGLSRRQRAGWTLAAFGAMLFRRGATGHCHTYDLIGFSTANPDRETRRALAGGRGTVVAESVTINRPVEEVYAFWRNLGNLPRFMKHLESVEQVTDTLSRWRARVPGETTVEWNAEIINEVPNEVIGWRSLEGSDVISAGSVNFDDEGLGTRVRLRMQYSVPGGRAADAVAKLVARDAATEIREDLARLKDVLERREDRREESLEAEGLI
jgi:uncharacterized membrane protein